MNDRAVAPGEYQKLHKQMGCDHSGGIRENHRDREWHDLIESDAAEDIHQRPNPT
jgi:hypothetical protein